MKAALFGSILLASVLLVAIAAPWIAPWDANLQFLEKRLEGPSAQHWLGLDELGRDVLSRLLWGARISLAVGCAVVSLATIVGTLAGSIAGFAGGRVDALVMRTTEVFQAFPGILLAIALVAVLGPALEHLIFALVVVGWVGTARLVRAQVMAITAREFVAAARASGLARWRVLFHHVLPHVWPILLVQATLGMAGAIVAEAALSFLGLGVPPPTASWGSMINAGRSHLLDAPHVALFPGLAIFLLVLALNLCGDALSERWTGGGEKLR
ncbi:MAG TPA: ABC transporter permease [Thermoanaerobaculia bacterium]|nr:ABC transporter permease [Thermoanaerobaculia bacterium]